MNKRIILIGHMPCTAGTFYTHYIAKIISKSKPTIIPETNPFNVLHLKYTNFFPYSINTVSHLIGFRTFEEYTLEYKNELINFIKKWQRENSNNLIIRDHVWGEYSNYKTHSLKEPIISKFLKEEGIDYLPIFTKRDPIDSWLGLNASFPDIEIDLNEYSEIYSSAINAWRGFHKSKLIEIKIEDFVKNKQKIKSIFKKNLNMSLEDDLDKKKLKKEELTSGASGRGSNYPRILKRKPYSYYFWKEIIKNDTFLEFRKDIGYQEKFKYANIFDLILSYFHLLYQPIMNFKIKNKKIKYFLKLRFLAYR